MQRIYIDTSVIGGYYDIEFETATKLLFERIVNREFVVYFSEVNEAELTNAPQQIKEVKNLIPADCFCYVNVTNEEKHLHIITLQRKRWERQAKTMRTTLHWHR